MKSAPAGPLDGATRTRPGGWLPHPLTTRPAAAIAQARVLLDRHHPGHPGPLRCLTARYRSHTFALGDPPHLIVKRHADQAAYLGEVLAYQLLDGEEVVPALAGSCDASRTLLIDYIPHPVDLTSPAAVAELVQAAARVHTASARWPAETAAPLSPWRIGTALEEPTSEWITGPRAWRRMLRLVQGAHGPEHVPLGHLDLKSDHARRRGDGRLALIDAETLRPDLTGLPDLVTLAYLAAEIGCPRSPRWVRHTYLAAVCEMGAHWVDHDLVAALHAFAAATGLRALHGVAD